MLQKLGLSCKYKNTSFQHQILFFYQNTFLKKITIFKKYSFFIENVLEIEIGT